MVVKVIEAARLMWCPGLAQLTGQPQGGLHDWLAKGTYAPTIAAGAIVLSGINSQHLLGALGADINRLSSAASETLRNIAEIKDIPKSLAWPYIKLYYASLFYVHTVLRLWGRSPSFFRTEELLPLRGALTAYGVAPPFKVTTGQFSIRADTVAGTVTIMSENGGDGAHEAVWKQFVRALDDWDTATLGAPLLAEDKNDIGHKIKLFRSLITKGGGNFSWPSQMRNNIQYRQAEGVWYPYVGKMKTSALQQDVEALFEQGGDLTKLMSSNGTDLVQFRSACSSIICFARAVIDDMSTIGGAKSFLRYGQRKFEDAANAA